MTQKSVPLTVLFTFLGAAYVFLQQWFDSGAPIPQTIAQWEHLGIGAFIAGFGAAIALRTDPYAPNNPPKSKE